MFKIVKKETLTPVTVLMEVEAPRLAASVQPGQFLIVKAGETGERIPLTVCDYDRENGTVTIVIQIAGASSRKIFYMEEGDSFTDVVGPLGNPSEFVNVPDEELKGKSYVFIAGGLGTAPVYPQARYLHERGACVDVILGAKTSALVIMKERMSSVCDNLYICTDDGSEGDRGLVTLKLEKLLQTGRHYDMGVAIGPMIMMKFVTLTAKKYSLPLTVSLNMIMVDGTGMCGACRVSIGGETKFACVDGPEFDAYKVDFDEALRRQTIFKEKETETDHKCLIGRGKE
ncbi:MAG: sulfide/dihydroorotate dehydrogenase-like FAD/NAD-binding protein [Bacteroidales bacterium]|jgi:NAD(P)H-flavin reductase|nr:sulfide/dihydroorotate dehydrogenase-like FAD/NAD-binding protein [Bacteroidales bacterium]